MSKALQINHLDHVALRVKNIEHSVAWYQKVLGLKKFHPKEWKEFPVFLLAGTSGIAFFPQKVTNEKNSNPNYDHFAFNVDNENFQKAQEHLKDLDINFTFQDHHYFHSIYFRDPDANVVELTTLVVDGSSVY